MHELVRLMTFCLAVYGLAAAVTLLSIGDGIRVLAVAFQKAVENRRILGWMAGKIAVFVHCPACVGFWVGCATSAWVYPGPSKIWYVDGFVALGACWIIHVVLCCIGMHDKV